MRAWRSHRLPLPVLVLSRLMALILAAGVIPTKAGEMGFIRKAIHLQSQFGHNHLADAHVDPGHLIKDANGSRAAQWLGTGVWFVSCLVGTGLVALASSGS
jgi:hypothetical protein